MLDVITALVVLVFILQQWWKQKDLEKLLRTYAAENEALKKKISELEKQ